MEIRGPSTQKPVSLAVRNLIKTLIFQGLQLSFFVLFIMCNMRKENRRSGPALCALDWLRDSGIAAERDLHDFPESVPETDQAV